jgi:hypothetical protein
MTFEQMLAQAKQLYNGTQELQRVYNGETMVWNRYNWDKYNCVTTTEEKTVWTDTVVSSGYTASPSSPTSSAIYDTYRYMLGYYPLTGHWNPSIKYSGTTYPTLADIAATGQRYVYIYLPSSPRNYLKVFLTDISGGKYRQELHENVSSTQTVTSYSKGSTYYGVVHSVKGKYPSNGRASDGYWYVAKGAVYFGGS